MALGLVPTTAAVRNRTKVAGAGVGVVAIVLIVLAAAGVFSGSGTVGQVHLVTAASGSPATPHGHADPFGAPSATADYSVPPPPGQPTMVATIGTKTTQRLYGADPFQEAVSVTQHVWPAALPGSAPHNNVPDRP